MVVTRDTTIGEVLAEDMGAARFFFEIGMHLSLIHISWLAPSTSWKWKNKKHQKSGFCRFFDALHA